MNFLFFHVFARRRNQCCGFELFVFTLCVRLDWLLKNQAQSLRTLMLRSKGGGWVSARSSAGIGLTGFEAKIELHSGFLSIVTGKLTKGPFLNNSGRRLYI